MTAVVDRAFSRLCERMRKRGVLDLVEAIARYHGVALIPVFSLEPEVEEVSRDVAVALYRQGIALTTLSNWFDADWEEISKLVRGDREQTLRLRTILASMEKAS